MALQRRRSTSLNIWHKNITQQPYCSQETHASDTSRLKICGYQLAAHTESNIYRTATFVKNGSKWKIAATCPAKSILNWTAVEIEGTTVINVHKPPVSVLNKSDIPIFPPPFIYAGDFNCHSTAW